MVTLSEELRILRAMEYDLAGRDCVLAARTGDIPPPAAARKRAVRDEAAEACPASPPPLVLALTGLPLCLLVAATAVLFAGLLAGSVAATVTAVVVWVLSRAGALVEAVLAGRRPHASSLGGSVFPARSDKRPGRRPGRR